MQVTGKIPGRTAIAVRPGTGFFFAIFAQKFGDISSYQPEPYWSEVARRIEDRGAGNVIAGDDEPYYRYKRRRFLEMLRSAPMGGRDVLEVGHGPGGNLMEVLKLGPRSLTGVDISQDMIDLARKQVPAKVKLIKIDGTRLPFEDGQFEVVFTATVLQHNTDEEMLRAIVGEICRVASKQVVLFERVESEIKGDELCLGRPVAYYASLVRPYGFELENTRFVNVRVSYFMAGAIRKLLNPKSRVEGEPLSPLSVFLQRLMLPVTSLLDRIFPSRTDVCRMTFIRSKQAQ